VRSWVRRLHLINPHLLIWGQHSYADVSNIGIESCSRPHCSRFSLLMHRVSELLLLLRSPCFRCLIVADCPPSRVSVLFVNTHKSVFDAHHTFLKDAAATPAGRLVALGVFPGLASAALLLIALEVRLYFRSLFLFPSC
jgi:hypothetical protein